MSIKNWFQLIGMACAAFIFNTSEFIPIGLLSDIAQDFHKTEAETGMIISVYAWMVCLLSLPLMLLVSKMEMKKLLLWVMGCFIFFQAMSYASTSYYALMFSRIGVACTHAIFWSIASPIAVRIVSEKYKDIALSVIVTGTSVAMIFGLPLGRIIGLLIGWRMTFLCIGIFALLIFLYLLWDLPKVPSRGGFSVQKMPELIKNPLLISMYVLSLALATSYYTGYSYIEPFLKQVTGMSEELITLTLMIFGGAGIIGSLLFSKYYSRNPFRFTTLILSGVTLCLLGIRPLDFSSFLTIGLCALWGLSVTAFNVALQAEIINNSPQEGTAVSMSIFSGIFNLGIGCGTLVGGAVCTYSSIENIGYVGGIIALFTLIYWRKRVIPLLQIAQKKS